MAEAALPPNEVAARQDGRDAQVERSDTPDEIRARRKRDVVDVATLYAICNDSLRLQRLHNYAEDLEVSGRWQAMARSNLRDEFYRIRRDLGTQLLARRSKAKPQDVAAKWLAKREQAIAEYLDMADEIELRGQIDFATLSVIAQELRNLISS